MEDIMSIPKYQRFVWPALLCVVLCVQYASAQTVTGSISGTVVDTSGNAVSGATITLINEQTRDTRVLTTGESGDFRFTAVLPGTYTVKVEQRGFSAFQRQGNVLTANEHLSVGELTMKVGELSETVTTVAEGTPVQTESTAHSALISSKQLQLISQRGRDVTAEDFARRLLRRRKRIGGRQFWQLRTQHPGRAKYL